MITKYDRIIFIYFKGDLDEDILDTEFSRTCPTTRKLFPESVRKPLQDLVSGVCVKTSQPGSRKLKAADFQTNNPEHLKIVRDMGISMLTLNDGRVQLLHTFSSVGLFVTLMTIVVLLITIFFNL